MSIEELRRLAGRAEGVEGRQAGRLEELHGRIATARRRRAASAATTAALVVTALVAGGAILTQSRDQSDTTPPVQTPTPTLPPTPTGVTPDGQETVIADFGPEDVRAWELRGSHTNADAGSERATDLSLVVETGGLYAGQSHVVPFCKGGVDTWWVLTFDLDGVTGTFDPSKGAESGSRGMFGRCSPDSPSTVPPPTDLIDKNRYNEAPFAYPFRMFVTDSLPAEARSCITGGEDAIGCVARSSLTPLGATEVTFGFGVYEHLRGPSVLEVLGWHFEALADIEGVEYLVDRAVLAPRGASRLEVTLPASNRPRLVALVTGLTPAYERCVEDLDIAVVDAKSATQEMEAIEEQCENDLVLRIDGVRARTQDWYLGEQQALIPTGEAHVVTIDVTRNDPSNTRHALAIWEARS